MKRLILALVPCLLAAACTTLQPAAPATQLLRDTLYPGPHQTATVQEIFALTDEMKEYVDRELGGQLRMKGLQRGLLEALYSKRQLRLEYDAERTRNASEAFAARSGNCLSLVIMTSALARHLGLQVSYRSVYNEDTWTRHNDTVFNSGHVNVTLSPRPVDTLGRGVVSEWTVDFLPAEDMLRQVSREIDESTIAAMYMNNRAAESLAAGDRPAAYGWARAATLQQPGFMSAYNTLAVVYLRDGHLDAAEQALAHVLERDKKNTVAMANMVKVLAAQGRRQESAALAQTLARLDPEPPFHFFDLGQAALARGDYAAARGWFKKEVSRAPYHHEFHYWLAVAEAGVGDARAAREQLTQALSTSTTRRNRQLYAAKLDKLNADARLN
jgi:tetratricopeptide (TPR) repeat protein